jgi:Tol biopolymer transport system component
VLFAGSDETGLWTANLDGTNFKRIITPKLTDNGLQAIDSPSWTPDGRWVAFGETWSGQRGGGRIAKCDANGNDLVYFTGGPGDCQPRVSPDGTEIVYGHVGDAKTGGLYLIGIDGKDQRQMLNPNGKPVTGTYPAWSPDGKKIYAVGAGIIEISTGNTLLRKSPRSINADGKTIEQYSNVVMPHWGKRGLLCSGWGGGITLVDDQFDVQRILADSGKATPK